MNRIALLAAAGVVTLSLAACKDDRARVDAPAPAPLAELTTEAADLPYAEPAPVEVSAPDQGYRWAERAYGLQRAVYDTPPDYGFAYDDVEPLVWQTQDDWSLYAEPSGGGYRYYYYEPGAAYPYFVRDADYGYAYDPAGVLIALFDSGGRYLPRETVYRYAPEAGRYYVRGRDLRNAGLQARRIRVTDQAWSVAEPRVLRTADPWMRGARETRDWRAWRERDHDRELARFEPEARRRTPAQHAWLERRDRLATATPRDVLAERQLQQRQDARLERRRDARVAQARQAQLQQAQHQQEQRQEARAQQHRAQQQREVRQAQVRQGQRQEAQAAQERRQQAQLAERRREQASRQQARTADRRQAQQAEARQQRQAQRAQAQQHQQQAHATEQRQAQQAQLERRRQRAADQQQARARAQHAQAQHGQEAHAQRAQAAAAEAHGRPAAARERNGGKGHDKKD